MFVRSIGPLRAQRSQTVWKQTLVYQESRHLRREPRAIRSACSTRLWLWTWRRGLF